jgi:FeS assembly SUF system protein
MIANFSPASAKLIGALLAGLNGAVANAARATQDTQMEPRSDMTQLSEPNSRVGRSDSSPEAQALYEEVVLALRTVFDPEIPVNIYDLGLIYRIDVIDRRDIDIDMTLTAPGCPVAGEMVGMTKKAVDAVDGVASVKINLVFDPPWHQSMMSDEAKLELGFFDS